MLFTAKLVEDRPAGKIMIGIAVTGVIFILISLLTLELSDLIPFFFSTLLISIVVMAVIFKGDLSNYKLVNDLEVYVDGMQISRLVFPFREVSELNFEFQSYQETEALYTAQEQKNKGFKSFGLGNNLSFVYRNQSFYYQFHLQSRQHFLVFVQMLEVLYENGIHFTERNLEGSTFLMQNMKADQLKLAKRQYGQTKE